MNKEMRIFCARLLTQIERVDNWIVAQMMQKEEFTFSQKFTHHNSNDAKNNEKKRQRQR